MDEEIVEKLKLNQLYVGMRLLKEFYGGLLNYIVSSVLRDERDAEECLDDVYQKICAGIEEFDPERRKLSSWLTVIARNTAVDFLRKNRPSDMELDENTAASPSPEDDLLREERRKALSVAIGNLPRAEQKIVYRKYYYLQSTAQLAAEMGITERTAERRLYRIRKKLKKALGGDFDER